MRNYYFSEKTAARLMNSVLKGATRDFLKKSWIDSAGRHCACDGFRAYRLNVPVPGVPDQDAAQGIDLNRVFPAFIDESKELDLPPLADLRAMIQEDRRAKPKRGETISTLAGSNIYTFGLSDTGAQLPAVNLKYLADFMLLFPDARAFIRIRRTRLFSEVRTATAF